MKIKLPKTNATIKKLYQCWHYDKENKVSQLKTCSSGATGCKAGWDSIGGEIANITYQSCFDNDVIEFKCSSELGLCKSPVPNLDPNPSKTGNSQTQKFQDFCCCTKHLCNDKSNLQSTVRTNSVHTPARNHSKTTTPLPALMTPAFTPPLRHSSTTTTNSDATDRVNFLLGYCVITTILTTIAFVLVIILSRKYFGKHFIRNLPSRLKNCFNERSRRCAEKINRDNQSRLLSLSSSDCDRVTQQTWVEGAFPALNLHINLNHPDKMGSFGQIYYAKDKVTSKIYCFKVPNDNRNDAFKNEVQIFQMLSNVEHANIVKYFGLHTEGTSTGLVLEYCSMGSLRDFLDKNVIEEMKVCLQLLSDLASGIAFLHSYDIAEPYKDSVVHRDIKSANILLRSDLCLVIADFGVATTLDQTDANNCGSQSKNIRAEGTPYYTAPEVLDLSIDLSNVSCSLKQADVYSLALVMWEVASRCKPFYDDDVAVPPHEIPYQSDVTNASELIDFVAVQGSRPRFQFLYRQTSKGFTSDKQSTFPNHDENQMEDVRRKLVKTIEECWDKDEDARLAASCVSRRMDGLSRSIPFAFTGISLSETTL